jgi:hypothetical protein
LRSPFGCGTGAIRLERADFYAGASDGKRRAMDQSEKIEFLGGQVHALVGFAHAIITSHPNLALLARHLDEIGKVNLATAETSAVREGYVLGVEDIRDRLKAAVTSALARKTNPK